MKISHHLFDAFYAAWHRSHHIMLVARVDTHVGIRRLDKHGIDSAISLFEIIQVTINGVLARNRIIEIAILHHQLGLQ